MARKKKCEKLTHIYTRAFTLYASAEDNILHLLTSCIWWLGSRTQQCFKLSPMTRTQVLSNDPVQAARVFKTGVSQCPSQQSPVVPSLRGRATVLLRPLVGGGLTQPQVSQHKPLFPCCQCNPAVCTAAVQSPPQELTLVQTLQKNLKTADLGAEGQTGQSHLSRRFH